MDILKAIAPLTVMYKKDIDNKKLELYVAMLNDINPVTLSTAVEDLIKNYEYLPTVATIRKKAKEISDYVNDVQELNTAQGAWELVIKAAQSYGYDKGLERLSGLTLTCAKSIWSSFDPRRGDDYNESSCRAQFIKQYEQMAVREQHRLKMANAIKNNGLLLEVRQKAEQERMALEIGERTIKMLPTGNLVEVTRKPVDVVKVIEQSDISDKGKELLKQAIGG